MTLAVTQSDFRANMKSYLDEVNDSGETVYVTRSNNRAVAVIEQNKLKWLEKFAKAREGSLDQAVAEDKLIELRVLPDNRTVVTKENEEEYWNQFLK